MFRFMASVNGVIATLGAASGSLHLVYHTRCSIGKARKSLRGEKKSARPRCPNRCCWVHDMSCCQRRKQIRVRRRRRWWWCHRAAARVCGRVILCGGMRGCDITTPRRPRTRRAAERRLPALPTHRGPTTVSGFEETSIRRHSLLRPYTGYRST